MATVIDALIVTLGINPAGVVEGQKKTSEALKKTRDDADSTAKELDFRGRQAASFFTQIRNQFLGLLAAFTAGAGLKNFAEQITNVDASAGRLAKNLGMSADELTAWQGVAARSGGTAEGIAGSMFGLSQSFQQLALTGQSDVVPFFRAVGVQIADAAGNMRPMRDILLDLSDAFSHMDPAKAQAIGAGMHLDQGTINTLIQGRQAIIALLAEQEKLGHANKADTDAAIKRQNAWNALIQTSEDLGRKIMTTLTPAILYVTEALTKLSEWARQHQPLVEAIFAGLAGAATVLTVALLAPLAELIAIAAAIGVAITAIGALYDDWRTWTEGGQATFGTFWQFFLDKWNDVRAVVMPIIEGLKTVFGDVVQSLKDYLELLRALFFGTGDDIRAAWDKLFKDLGKEFLDLVDVITKAGPAIFDAIKSAFSAAFDWVEDRAYAIWNAITHRHDVPAGRQQQQGGAGAPGGGGGTAAPSSGTTGSADSDIAKFVSLGWTKQQAAGIVANIQAESSGNSGRTGDNGQAFGLAQWHPDRQRAFAAWAGHDIRESTRDEQLNFINYELREGSEKAAGTKLAAVNDARAAGEIVSRDYERPGDQAGEMAKRGRLASSIFAGVPIDQTAAPSSVASSTVNNGGDQSTTSTTQIGQVNIQTQATDADGIGRDLQAALEKYSYVPQANTGLDN